VSFRLTGRAWIAVAVVAAAAITFLYSLTQHSRSRGSGDTQVEIGVLVEHSGRQLESSFTQLLALDTARLRIREILPPGIGSASSWLPDSLDVLVVLGSGHLPDARLYELDQFIMSGGRAAFFLDGAALSEDRTKTETVRGNLFAYVGKYGATTEPDIVIDPESSSTAHGLGSNDRPYAFWPLGVPGRGDAAEAIMPADRTTFTWCSSVTATGQGGAELQTVASSSPTSWSTIAFADVSPEVEPEPRPALPGDETEEKRGERVLAVAIEGSVASAFRGMPVIVEDADGSVEFTEPRNRLNVSAPTRILVCGSSTMFEDWIVERVPANLTFLRNALVWLGSE